MIYLQISFGLRVLKTGLTRGFSKCGSRTTTGTPNTVYWLVVLIQKKNRIKKDKNKTEIGAY